MNRTKVVKAISLHRARIAGKIPPHSCSPDSEIDYMVHAIEALEEIASEHNIEVLRRAISWMSGQVGNETAKDLAILRGMMVSVQVPKEVVYAYPVTMERHFCHYVGIWFDDKGFDSIPVVNKSIFKDDFGCGWKSFTGPKELVDFLRENNVAIKVCE